MRGLIILKTQIHLQTFISFTFLILYLTLLPLDQELHQE